MANFDTIYTGKGLTPEFQSDGGKAMSRLSDFITRAEEIKYKAFKDNEEWFLNTQDIDSAFLISTKNQEVATQLMDTYNKESAAIYKRYNGNPPLGAKQEILAKKNFLIANQNKMIAKEKLAEQHKAMVEQNPLRYDKNKFYEQYDKFVSTGDYDLVIPPLKSKNPSSVFREQSKKLYPKSFETGTRINALGQRISMTTNIKDEDIPVLIENTIKYGDDQFIQGINEDFLADNSKEKWALMEDTDNDGQITNNDITENAVIAWAKQNPEYIKAVKIEDELTPKNPPKTSATTTDGFNSKLPIGPDNNKNSQYPVRTGRNAPTRRYGTIKDADWIQLGHIPQQRGEPLLIDEIVDYSSGSPVRKTTKTITDTETGDKTEKPISTQVRFNIIAYLPKDDVILVEIDDDVRPFSKGEKVPLPADKYDEILKSKPLNYYRESTTKENLRADGSKKGNGFLGVLKRPDGSVSTELSIGVNIGGREMEIPTLIPTLTDEEKKYLLATPPDKIFTANPTIFKGIKEKAIKHAQDRINKGLSPFKESGGELDDL